MSFHCARCHAEIDRSFKACPHCGEAVTDFLREYADKLVDGKYRILERLGAGGMGDVYKVEHTFLGAVRVIKVIRAQIAGSDEAHDRFLREARLATKVQHANVANLHDFSALPDGSHYMVWEFIDGENLAQLLRLRPTLPPRYAVQLIRQALAGLEAIHRAGIVHRDISPENLMLTRAENGEERVKIIDLGVAKGDEADQSMTKTGMFVGKLRYCSPEHLGFLVEGEKIDGRADLYSLAIVLYEMLSGRAPFEATSPHQYILHHSREEQLRTIDLHGVAGSAELQAILARALERDRRKRYANAREFGDALASVEKTLPLPDPGEGLDPLDGDPTIRQTPPALNLAHASGESTIRTEAARITEPARILPQATQRQSQTTQRTDGSSFVPPTARQPAIAPEREQSHRSAAPLLTAGIIILGLLGAIGYLTMRRPDANPSRQSIPVEAAPNPAATLPSQTSFDVAAASTASTPTVVTAAPAPISSATVVDAPVQATTIASPAVQTSRPNPPPAAVATKRPPVQPTIQPRSEPAPRLPEAPATGAMTYTEKGDSTANEATITAVQQLLQGTASVSVDGNGDPEQIKALAGALRKNGMQVAESADVAIHFNGLIERRGLGRKRRSADATITKAGRVLLHYTLPPEDYRVGDSPAEAFARVLSELLK